MSENPTPVDPKPKRHRAGGAHGDAALPEASVLRLEDHASRIARIESNLQHGIAEGLLAPAGPKVYAALSLALGDLAKVGLAKTRTNVEQRFNFRGIDELMNVAAPIFAHRQLLVLPRVIERVATERLARSGSVMFNVALVVEFDFVSAVDGSKHTVRLAGEATDTGDKATNKAMSAAFKYCLLQSLCIPLEGEGEDADLHTNEASVPKPPDGYDEFLQRAVAFAGKGVAVLRAAWKEGVNNGEGALWQHLVERDAVNWKLVKGKADDVDAATAPQQEAPVAHS